MVEMDRPIQINDLSRHHSPIMEKLQSTVARVISSGRFVLGEECAEFEKEFAAYCGASHCVSVANGTDAIEITLRALGISRVSRVATVANVNSCALEDMRVNWRKLPPTGHALKVDPSRV